MTFPSTILEVSMSRLALCIFFVIITGCAAPSPYRARVYLAESSETQPTLNTYGSQSSQTTATSAPRQVTIECKWPLVPAVSGTQVTCVDPAPACGWPLYAPCG